MTDIIKTLDKRLIATETTFSGLASGKMGHCLYFYCMGRITGNREYEHFAEKLTDSIIEDIDNVTVYDIKNGLSGIGLCFNYLINNEYIKGDINVILKDIDSRLFMQLCKSEQVDFTTQLHLLYYFAIRLKKQRQGSESEQLFRGLIIQEINHATEKITSNMFEESLLFSIENPVIQLLYVFYRCFEIHQSKIKKTLEEVTPHIVSKIPYLQFNRLLLFWVMGLMNSKLKNERWANHINLLRKELDIVHIIENEMKGRNIYISDGLPALYHLLLQAKNSFEANELRFYLNSIYKKLTDSKEWEFLENDGNYFKKKSGLYSGYCGASLLLNQMKRP